MTTVEPEKEMDMLDKASNASLGESVEFLMKELYRRCHSIVYADESCKDLVFSIEARISSWYNEVRFVVYVAPSSSAHVNTKPLTTGVGHRSPDEALQCVAEYVDQYRAHVS